MINKNLDNFIEGQLRYINSENMYNLEYGELYDFISNKSIHIILSSLHAKLTVLFKTMNDRLPTKENGAHFWADPSRDLSKCIDTIFTIKANLKSTEFSFEIDPYYSELLYKCRDFLSSSGGSTLPPHMNKVTLYYKIPIFIRSNTITTGITEQNLSYELKLIGGGSYANVYKYKDDFYNRFFALKQAKKDLTPKELERFYREFEEMKKLSSPYIIEVYTYIAEKNQYVMEFMDYTLKDYIEKNTTIFQKEKRKSIIQQILRAFHYINSKDRLHRDISPHNILVKQYEDVDVIKISDFGLVKIPTSSLTSRNSEFKGSFNDPALVTEGFGNYYILHETYALTKIVFFVMTGKTNTSTIEDNKLKEFVHKGLNPEKNKRFQNAEEMLIALKSL